jgi:hypothetical protein
MSVADIARAPAAAPPAPRALFLLAARTERHKMSPHELRQAQMEQQKQNALAIVNDADLAALAAAARELAPTDIVGLPLKYAKGRWTVRETKDAEVDVRATDPFVVDVLSYREGWFRWENKKPTHKFLGRRVDGFISPPRHVLPEADQDEWPIGPKGPTDPWQEVQQLVLRDLTTGQLVTWTTNSYGGRLALGELFDNFVTESKKHPALSPVVLLTSYDRPTADYGKVPAPRFKLIDWQAFGEDASPPGEPSRLTALRQQLEALKTVALPKPTNAAEPAKRNGGDMDDEIPF